MIQLSCNTIMILQDDGTLIPFDADEIQTKIIRSCIAAGETDSWIAGDLSLSVEFALLEAETHLIRTGELAAMVVRVLEDSGYPSVAAEYQRMSRVDTTGFVPVTQESVRTSIEGNLALSPERTEALVAPVTDALKLLGFHLVNPHLILELARQFRDNETPPETPRSKTPSSPVRDHPVETVLLFRQEMLGTDLLSPQLKNYLDHAVLRLQPVSRLFPSVRIDLSLSAFAELEKLEKPVTELAFWSVCRPLAESVNELFRITAGHCFGNADGQTPFYLSIRDAVYFAMQSMNCPEEASKSCISGLMSAFLTLLKQPPFKVTLT